MVALGVEHDIVIVTLRRKACSPWPGSTSPSNVSLGVATRSCVCALFGAGGGGGGGSAEMQEKKEEMYCSSTHRVD